MSEREIFKISRTKNGVAIKNVSEDPLEIISVNIYYYYTVARPVTSLEEIMREKTGMKLSRENIIVNKKIDSGDILEIEFRPSEMIDSIEIFYNDKEGVRKKVLLKL